MTKLQLRELKLAVDKSIANGSIKHSDYESLSWILDRLIADCWERCACCYNWVQSDNVISVASNNMSAYPKAFVLCDKCIPVKGGGEDRFELRVRSYIAKGEHDGN